LVRDPVLELAGVDLPEQREGSRGLSSVRRRHSSSENPRRTCVRSTNTRARVRVSARSKFEQNNLNSHEPVQASNAAHEPNRPLCGVGDHVWRFCVHGDTPNGQTRTARESVLTFSLWILCGQGARAVETLHVKPDLLVQTIETLTWLESSWKELEGPSL
jgi:hypothetical protein